MSLQRSDVTLIHIIFSCVPCVWQFGGQKLVLPGVFENILRRWYILTVPTFFFILRGAPWLGLPMGRVSILVVYTCHLPTGWCEGSTLTWAMSSPLTLQPDPLVCPSKLCPWTPGSCFLPHLHLALPSHPCGPVNPCHSSGPSSNSSSLGKPFLTPQVTCRGFRSTPQNPALTSIAQWCGGSFVFFCNCLLFYFYSPAMVDMQYYISSKRTT